MWEETKVYKVSQAAQGVVENTVCFVPTIMKSVDYSLARTNQLKLGLMIMESHSMDETLNSSCQPGLSSPPCFQKLSSMKPENKKFTGMKLCVISTLRPVHTMRIVSDNSIYNYVQAKERIYEPVNLKGAAYN